MRRALTAAVIAAALAGCGSRHAGGAGAGAAVTPSFTPQQLCVSVVDNWLQSSIDATQDGYPLGVDSTPLLERYGSESAIYQAFVTLNGQLVDYIGLHGVEGAYQSVAGQTSQTCAMYGAEGTSSQATPTPVQSPVASAASPSWSPSADPYSTGCPTSSQLLAAWNAAPASFRASWTTLTVTGFFSTECWHQWVVTNPVMQGNGPVIFTDASGRLTVFPATDLREFDAAVCGVAGAPSDWSGGAGPATCS